MRKWTPFNGEMATSSGSTSTPILAGKSSFIFLSLLAARCSVAAVTARESTSRMASCSGTPSWGAGAPQAPQLVLST